MLNNSIRKVLLVPLACLLLGVGAQAQAYDKIRLGLHAPWLVALFGLKSNHDTKKEIEQTKSERWKKLCKDEVDVAILSSQLANSLRNSSLGYRDDAKIKSDPVTRQLWQELYNLLCKKIAIDDSKREAWATQALARFNGQPCNFNDMSRAEFDALCVQNYAYFLDKSLSAVEKEKLKKVYAGLYNVNSTNNFS